MSAQGTTFTIKSLQPVRRYSRVCLGTQRGTVTPRYVMRFTPWHCVNANHKTYSSDIGLSPNRLGTLCVIIFSLFLMLGVRPVAAKSTTFTWNAPTDGTWNSATNWIPNGIPNSVMDTAIMVSIITSPQPVFSSTPVTVTRIEFANEKPYTLTGNGGFSSGIEMLSNALSEVECGSQE